MSLTHVIDQDLSFHCVSNCAPIVFVVDDDISVRESLEALIRFEGWEPKLQDRLSVWANGTRTGIELPPSIG